MGTNSIFKLGSKYHIVVSKGALEMAFKYLGQRIREERTRLRLTQEQLAEIAEVNESYIGQIERSEKNPSLETVVSIANALGVTVDYLLQEEIKAEPDGLLREILAVGKTQSAGELRLVLNIMRMISDFNAKR